MRCASLAIPVLLLNGCGGFQSADGRDGVEGALIGELYDVFFWVTLAVYLFVIAFLVAGVWRGRRHRREGSGLTGEPAHKSERLWHAGLLAFTGTTAVILAGLTIATWLTDRAIAQGERPGNLEIEVVGHQWWWEVRYLDVIPSRIVRTANELHLPVGQTARITLKSGNVIHSLWVPNLAGKQDLIPGRSNDLVLRPERTGVFRAQCAEFCGTQHARMALDVTIESEAEFVRWKAAQLEPPPVPQAGEARAGYELFLSRQCSSCHRVAGTSAQGLVAPDLSHVASRRTIAAGTLPVTRANFAVWVDDPQAIKPGNHMPEVPMTGAEVSAVSAYLETLR
jgi:cytochrome c oxidase subunit II